MRIGVDLGGHKIAAGVVEKGKVVNRAWEPTPRSRTPEETTEAIERLVKSLKVKSTKSVGIGLPGMLSLDRRSVVRLTNLPRWENFPMAEILEKKLSLPVALDNDGNCAALGEMESGKAVGIKDFVMMTLGTGIGGAIVSGGRLIRGHRGLAGEIGHVALLHSAPCNCGGIGHGETLFSADTFDLRCSEKGVPSVPDLWDRRNDEEHRNFWNRSLEGLACVMISAIHLLDPEAIVLAGGLSNLPELVQELKPFLDERLATAFRPMPPLKISSLGKDGPVIGAASLTSTP